MTAWQYTPEGMSVVSMMGIPGSLWAETLIQHLLQIGTALRGGGISESPSLTGDIPDLAAVGVAVPCGRVFSSTG